MRLAIVAERRLQWVACSSSPKKERASINGLRLVQFRLSRVETILKPVERRSSSVIATIWDRMKAYKTPVVSLAIIDNFNIVAAKTYSLEKPPERARFKTSCLFQAASISKPVTAMAVLRLVQEQRLSLDKDVNEYLVSWKIPKNKFTRTRHVTLRDLLTHTAGITVTGFPGYKPNQDLPNLCQILDGLSPTNTDPVRVDARPGSSWRYSGGGFTIIQQLLADVTGQSFPDFMRETVLAGCGKTSIVTSLSTLGGC